jgi:RNA polymerase-binding transcription factor
VGIVSLLQHRDDRGGAVVAVAAVEHRAGQQDHSKARSSRSVSIAEQVVGGSATWASITGLQVAYEELSGQMACRDHARSLFPQATAAVVATHVGPVLSWPAGRAGGGSSRGPIEDLTGGGSGMEEERARALLREERQRLERLLALVDADHDRVAPADEVSEDLVDGADRRVGEETDEALARQLNHRMQALQRAEGRLTAGTYGRSVLSGQPIPDERLEAFPLAELTVDEEAAQERADRPIVQAVERAADGQDGATVEGEDRAGRDRDQLDAAQLGPSREPFQVLDDPAVQDDQLVEDDETTFDEPPAERDPAMPEVPDGVAEDDTGRIRRLP